MYLLEKVNLSLKHTDSGSEPQDWISGHVENGNTRKMKLKMKKTMHTIKID